MKRLFGLVLLVPSIVSFLKSFLWLPSLIGFLVYFQSLFFSSTWDDDYIVITPEAKDFNFMLRGFYENLPGHHFFPFSFFQCYLINKIFGDNALPFGFHVYSLLLQTITCLIVTLIFYKLTNSKLISILAISLWTVHPINVETVTRLGCIPAQLPSATFCLLSLLFLLKGIECNNHERIFHITLCIFFYLVSVTTYEQYIFFPIVALLLVCARLKSRDRTTNKTLTYLSILFFLVILSYALWRYLASGGNLFETSNELFKWNEVGTFKDIAFRAFWLAPQLLVHYLRLFFWPNFLSEAQADWFKVGNPEWGFYSLGCQLFVFILLLLAIILYKKNSLFSIGVFWFLIFMIPVIQIFPLFTMVDEHYCYLSTLGLLLSLSSLVTSHLNKLNSRLIIILFFPVFCLLTWRTLIYLPNHKDKFAQVVSMALHSPQWTKPAYIYEALTKANVLHRTHELPQSINKVTLEKEEIKWLKGNLNANPDLSLKYGPMQNYNKYGTYSFFFKILYFHKRYDLLEILVRQALAVKCDTIGFYNYAQFLREVGEYKKSYDALKKAIELNPMFDYSYPLIILLAKETGKLSDVEKIIKKYITLKPKSSYPYLLAGSLYVMLNREEIAAGYFKDAINSGKSVSINHKNLYWLAVECFINNQMYPDAIQTAKIILSFNPFDEKTKKILARLEKSS